MMTSSRFGLDMSRRLFVAESLYKPMVVLLPNAISRGGADLATLKPCEFAWTPARAPSGPVVILASIPRQWVDDA